MRWSLIMLMAAIAWFGVTTATAKVETPAQVRYATQSGTSDWEKTNVTLVKGSELNKATRSLSYDHFSGYALIWFSQDQVAVIELETPIFGCSTEFEASCIPRIGNMEGKDQGGRRWEICTGQFC